MNKIQNKKNKIKKILIQDNEQNYTCLYNLINSDILDDIICKLDDSDGKKFNSEEQFILLMNRLISSLSDNYNLGSKVHIVLKMILEGCNKKLLENYLLCKNSVYHEESRKYFQECIDKIIIFNFYENLKYLNNDFLLKSLSIKHLNFDKKEFRDRLKNVLIKIVNVNYMKKFVVCLLFENINLKISNSVDKKKLVINEYMKKYHMLIDNYLKYNKTENLKIRKTYDCVIVEIEKSTKLNVYYPKSNEICHITANDNNLLIEEVPFKEVIDLSIQHNCFPDSKKVTLNGIYYKKYIDDYYDKYEGNG